MLTEVWKTGDKRLKKFWNSEWMEHLRGNAVVSVKVSEKGWDIKTAPETVPD